MALNIDETVCRIVISCALNICVSFNKYTYLVETDNSIWKVSMGEQTIVEHMNNQMQALLYIF